MSQDPSSDPTEAPGPTSFERYLEEVRMSMQLQQLNLTSSAVSMERCRNAIEWQQAVYQQFSLITEAFKLNVCRLDDWGRMLISQSQLDSKQRETWLSLRSMAVPIDQSVRDMASRSQVLQTQLLMLNDAVVKLEQLSDELARFNDAVGEQVTLFSNVLDTSSPLKAHKE